MTTKRRSYHRNQSRLFKITSPNMLAKRLGVELSALRMLERAPDNYMRWTDKKTGRPIQEPKAILARVHRRVAKLLSRIETPDFLHSAIKGRSYISNAAVHAPDQSTAKIDLRKYYPSTRLQAVFHFFRDRMECDADVAGILANLLTVDSHLATGSSASPILSYFAYEDMFLEIDALARERGCVMTCYVDDMVFTGPGANRRLFHDVIKIVRKYRLWGHKTKLFKPGQPKVITGVAITASGARLPNKRQKAIANDLSALPKIVDDKERIRKMSRLSGRLFEAANIDSNWSGRAAAFAADQRGLQRRIVRSIRRKARG